MRTHAQLYSAAFRCIPQYYSPAYSRGALKTLHKTVLPALMSVYSARKHGQLSQLCYRTTHGTEPTLDSIL